MLSVVAQQVLTIQKAKRGRETKFLFEGTTLMLNPDANVFITMVRAMERSRRGVVCIVVYVVIYSHMFVTWIVVGIHQRS